MPLNKRQLLGIAGIGAGIGALLLGVLTASRHSPESKDGPIKDLWRLALNTPTGSTIKLSTFKGKPLLVNFWATWCAPCIEEMPLLDKFHKENPSINDNSIQLLGIAADKSESVAKFLTKTPVQFPIAIAGFGGISLSQRLGNASGGLPYSALISKNGSILFKKEGQLNANDLKTMIQLASTS